MTNKTNLLASIPSINELLIIAATEYLPRTCSRADIDMLSSIIDEMHDSTDDLMQNMPMNTLDDMNDDDIDTAAAIILDRLDDPTFYSRLLDIALARYAPSALELTPIDSI